MDLELVSGSPYTMLSDAIAVSFGEDNFQPIIEYVNDEDYTAKLL